MIRVFTWCLWTVVIIARAISLTVIPVGLLLGVVFGVLVASFQASFESTRDGVYQFLQTSKHFWRK